MAIFLQFMEGLLHKKLANEKIKNVKQQIFLLPGQNEV